jgi:hypothetical protein
MAARVARVGDPWSDLSRQTYSLRSAMEKLRDV